jgi:hypothetical protein
MNFIGSVPEIAMVPRRRPGTDGEIELKSFRFLPNTTVEQLVTFAYREDFPVITRAVDQAVEEFIEETLKAK